MSEQNAVDILKDKLDVRKVLEYYNAEEINESGSFIRCCCPIHKGNDNTAFSINVETSLWRCFTGDECGGGDIYTFIEKIEGVKFKDAVKILANILEVNIDNMIIAQRKSSYQKELENWMKFVEKKKKRNTSARKEFVVKEEMLPLKKYRHFSEKTLRHFGASFIKKLEYINSKDELSITYDRICCPIYVDDIMVGISLRKTKAKEKVKWLHLPTGLGVGNLVYNIEACKEYDEIIICEGMFDVWSYYQAGIKNAVCVFGSKITEEQYKILFRTGKDIVLSFDGDDAGLKATKQAVELFRNKCLIYMIKFEEGVDPGSLSEEELLNLYKSKERLK